MRAIWKGSISFGLINIPVNLYSGAQSTRIDLDMLHKKDKEPIRYARICTADGKEVPYDQIVKGYKLDTGEYVVLTDEDFERAHAGKRNSIDLLQFSDEDDIDSVYFDKPYYLEPQKGAEKSYALLRDALKETKKVGLATYVLRNREHLAVVKPEGDLLVLNQLRYKGELRDPGDLKLPAKKATKQERDMAVSLIKSQTKQFDPRKYHDEYIKELERVIEAKAKHRPPPKKGKAPKPTKSNDLVKLLKKSLQEQRKSNTAAVRA